MDIFIDFPGDDKIEQCENVKMAQCENGSM